MHALCKLALAVLLSGQASASLPVRGGPVQLWIVDDTGGAGVDFTDLQSAVDGASDGDLLLVRAGSYAGFAIQGKGLSVVAEDNALVAIEGAQVLVRQVPAASRVLLQGLVVRGGATLPFAPAQPALRLEDNNGAVLLEECQFLPDSNGVGGGALVTLCSALSITRCTLEGGLPYFLTFVPLPSMSGVEASGSILAVYESTLRGGRGSSVCGAFGSCGEAQPAGAGLRLQSSFAFAAGSELRGGSGGNTPFCGPTAQGGKGSAGGHGAQLTDMGSELDTLDCALLGGAAGQGCGPVAPAGLSVLNQGGVLLELSGQARSLSAKSPVLEGQPVDVLAQGEPFDSVLLGFAPEPSFASLDAFSGVLLIDLTQLSVVPLGNLGASGAIGLQIATQAQAGADQAALYQAQALFLSSTGGLWLSSSTAVALHE